MGNKPNKKIEEFILANADSMTYYRMGQVLNLNRDTIKKYALRLGVSKPVYVKTQAVKIGLLLEFFANGFTTRKAAKIVGISESCAGRLLEQHYFTKQRSYNTVTLVIESRMNY